MKDIFLGTMQPNWTDAAMVAIRLFAAAMMGGMIGLERGLHGRAAGLRTHVVVCLGAALTSLCSLFVVEKLGYGTDVGRLSAQVVSGIGFLGAGMILIRNNSIITGLTTAAGMWTTAVIGIAVGYGFYSGAVVATCICVLIFTVLGRFEAVHKKEFHTYIELSSIKEAEYVIEEILALNISTSSYEITPPKSGHVEHVGIVCKMSTQEQYEKLRNKLHDISSVAMMVHGA